jgi:hypothetical protein
MDAAANPPAPRSKILPFRVRYRLPSCKIKAPEPKLKPAPPGKYPETSE